MVKTFQDPLLYVLGSRISNLRILRRPLGWPLAVQLHDITRHSIYEDPKAIGTLLQGSTPYTVSVQPYRV